MGGNIFTFVQEIEKIDFWDAVKELAKQQNIDMSSYENNSTKRAKHNDEKEKIKRMHTLAQFFFLEQLGKNPQAKSYLLNERKLPEALIQDFGIGFAPDSHYALIQLLRDKGFTDADILESSLAKKNANGEIYGFFRNRITFPIYDTMGSVVGFSARVINPQDNPKYLNSAEHKVFEKSKILYGLNFAKEGIRQQEKVIVVEGQMDVLGLHRLQYPIGVASSGTALSEQHAKLLKRYTENIYLMFDNDAAGNQALLRALAVFYQQNLFPKVIALPQEYKDIDDLANIPNGKEILDQVVDTAKDGFLHSYELLRTGMDLHSPVDKQKLIITLFELILQVQSLTIQEHYKNILAEQLGFAPEILNTEFRRFRNKEGKFIVALQQKKQEQAQKSKYELQRDQLIASLFYQNFLDQELAEYEKKSILTQLIHLIAKANPQELIGKVFLDTLSEEEQQQLSELSLRWENQLLNLEIEQKYLQILQTIKNHLQNLLKTTLKSNQLSTTEKSMILELWRQL